MGAAAFWIALGAVLIAGGWFRTRALAMKHETLRMIVEKTGTVDEAQLRELLNPPAPAWPAQVPPPWLRPRGEGYRVLRVFGTIVLFGAAGFALFALILDAPPRGNLGIAALIAMIGAGLFFASRFLRPPPDVEHLDR